MATRMFDPRDAATICRRYNLNKIARYLAGDNAVDTGFENEVSREVQIRSGHEPHSSGFMLPSCLITRALATRPRAFDKTTYGGNFVATDTLSPIEALVGACVLGKAGAQTLAGNVGDLVLPKVTSTASANWVSSEGGNATETTPATGNVTTSPKTIAAYCDCTRQVLLQTAQAARDFVLKELVEALKRGIEQAAFAGTGNDGVPVGLDNLVGKTAISLTAGAVTRDELVTAWGAIAATNADPSKLVWIAPSAVAADLAKRLDVKLIGDDDTPVGGSYLVHDDKLIGTPLLTSNLATAKKLYLGNFTDLVIASWGGVELNVDKHTLSKSGGVRLVAMMDCDFIWRHPAAFGAGQVLA